MSYAPASEPLRRIAPRLVAALCVGVLMAAVGTGVSFAKERKTTMSQGVTACKAWCDAHRVGNELAKCRQNCENYWMCNGSDATTQTCADAPPKVREAAPQPPPGRSVGPAFIPYRPKAKSN